MPKAKIIVAIMATVIIAIIGSAAAYAYTRTQNTNKTTSNTLQFVFNDTTAPGWRSGGNTNPQQSVDLETYDEENFGPFSDLPSASMIAFHRNSGDKPTHDDCFAGFSYYKSPLETIESAYKEHENKIDTHGSFELLGSQEQTIFTPEGSKTYELRSYRTDADSGGEFLSGNMIGFVALNDGHISISVTCQTPEDLAIALPVLAAVQLEDN